MARRTGDQKTRISGYQETRRSGDQKIRISGYQEIRRSGDQDISKSGEQETIRPGDNRGTFHFEGKDATFPLLRWATILYIRLSCHKKKTITQFRGSKTKYNKFKDTYHQISVFTFDGALGVVTVIPGGILAAGLEGGGAVELALVRLALRYRLTGCNSLKVHQTNVQIMKCLTTCDEREDACFPLGRRTARSGRSYRSCSRH